MVLSNLEKAMAPYSSTLAWKIPWTEKPGRLQSMESLRVGHDWVTSLSLFSFMHWRRIWQPTPVFLSGESQGWGAWWAAIYGVAQSQTRLKWLSSSSLVTGHPHCKIINLNAEFSPFTNINSRWNIDLSSKHKAMANRKQLWRKSRWLWIWWWLSRYNTRSNFMKEKIDELGFIKVEVFYSEKDTVKTMKRQVKDWEIYLSAKL